MQLHHSVESTGVMLSCDVIALRALGRWKRPFMCPMCWTLTTGWGIWENKTLTKLQMLLTQSSKICTKQQSRTLYNLMRWSSTVIVFVTGFGLSKWNHFPVNVFFNPLSPNINMSVLLSVPMFLMVLHVVGRICTNINTFHVWWSFLLFSWPVCLIK